MSHYIHLSIEEREKLYLMRGQGKRICEIGRELGRSASTISRELRRNQSKRHPYSPSSAQRAYKKRRKHCGRKHTLSRLEKREYIHHLIQDLHWSPEEIANRLKLEEAPYKSVIPPSIGPSVQGCLMQVSGKQAGAGNVLLHTGFAEKGRKSTKKERKTDRASTLWRLTGYTTAPARPMAGVSSGILKRTP